MLTRLTAKAPNPAATVKSDVHAGTHAQHPKVRQILDRPALQPKLEVSTQDDRFEQEAERVAEQVMYQPESMHAFAGALPTLGRGPRCIGQCSQAGRIIQRQASSDDEEEETVQAKRTDSTEPHITPETGATISSLRGGGQPLPGATRGFFEARFGADFSQVRVHAGSDSGSLARSINAKAFTHGRDIVFADGEYDPLTASGRKLLAHELTHVLQQKSAPELIQRYPYETRGIDLSRTQIATLAGQSYWEQRTFRAFDTTVDSRMNNDAEERDAVLSALWATNPATSVTSSRIQYLPVASRTLPAAAGGQPQTAPQLLYKLTFQPPVSRGQKPRLEIAFVTSGAAATAPVSVPAAAAGFTPSNPVSYSYSGFPGSATDPLAAYWTAHPQEHGAVFSHIQTSAPANYDSIIEATTSDTRGRVSHRSVFHIQGQHTGNTVDQLTITLLSEGAYTASAQQTVPTDYRDRDMGDLELETLQANSTAANRLGTITLPANIPADERLPVKYAIWQYFSAGNARNTEIDAIVPVGSGTRTVLYTFVFGANNDVTATRIGESGTGAGQVDVNRISVTRVNGFPGAGAATATLRTWWSQRYPQGGALTPDPAAGASGTAPTAAALITEMDGLIAAGIANRNWFDRNYGIEVLDAAGTATRLQNAHSVPQAMTSDTVDLDATDLRMLELSLQTLTTQMLGTLRGIKIGRKTASMTRSGSNYQAGGANQYGVTLMDSSGSTRNVTVLYFQSLYANNTRLFRGGTAAGALPEVTMNLLHEIGHAAGYNTPAIETAFQAWIASHPQTSPTWYAASSGQELFPEAYALYHTDPRFLCNSAPLLYAWFASLASTGTAPAATATLTAPTSCP